MTDDTEDTVHEEQWWLAPLGEEAVAWARLRVFGSGAAEIFGARGETLRYDDEDAARAALLDADFRNFDGMDEDDALALGLELDEIEPPAAQDDEQLLPAMIRKLG